MSDSTQENSTSDQLPAEGAAAGAKATAGGWSRRRFMTVAGMTTGTLAGASALAAPAALAGTLATTAQATGTAPRTQHGATLAHSYLMATHNSYSGNIAGARGSIVQQLDAGVRFIELDTNSSDYAASGGFTLGHDSVGDQVDHSNGNPASLLISDWAGVVATWSRAHPAAAPIVVMFDMKDSLAANASYATGNLGALNGLITEVFGDLLYPAELAPGPAGPGLVDPLRGKVLTLLSGDVYSRSAYLRDLGEDPAVAMNSLGQVVETHTDNLGRMHYFTGRYQADGTVSWQRTGIFGNGMTPAVALDDNGNVVIVYATTTIPFTLQYPGPYLWYQAGTLDSQDGEITWTAPAAVYDIGVVPTITFTGPNTLHTIARDTDASVNWFFDGTLNPATGIVNWDLTTHVETSQPLQAKATARQGARSISVSSVWQPPFDPQTIVYTTPFAPPRPIRLRQLAFDEYQDGDSDFLAASAPFWSSSSSDSSSFFTSSRQAGRITREWSFDDISEISTPPANYLATDTPYESWYTTLMQQLGAIQ